MNLEEKEKEKKNEKETEINQNNNNPNESKNSQDIVEEMKYKYRILNKFFKLEDLKNKEKQSRLQDELVLETAKKPAFFFMRNESKNEIRYKPVTTFCDRYRTKECSSLYKKYVDLNGFKNEKINIKTETEMLPSNFEDIISRIELIEIKNNIKTNRNLLPDLTKNIISIKHHLKTEENDYKKSNLFVKIRDNNTKKSLITKKNKNHTFSSLNNKNKDFFLSKNDAYIGLKKNKNNKRPMTSKYDRKYYIDNNINNNEKYEEEANHSFIKNQEGGDLNLDNSKKIIKLRNRNSSINKFNKNLSCLTTTFKSYSKSISKQGNKKDDGLLQKIEKQVLNPDSFFFNYNNEKSEFKTTKQIINRILNDGNIIDNYIKSEGQVKEEVFHKFDREEILLKLAEKLNKKKSKMKKIRLKDKPLDLEDAKHLFLEDEQLFKIKLSKIKNKYARDFFREVHNKIAKKIRLNLNDRKRLVELNKLNPKKYSLKNLNRLTGVNSRAIGEWKSNYHEICEQSNLNCCRVKKPVETPLSAFDNEILRYIDRLREEKKAVSSDMIIAKMIQLNPNLKDSKKKTLQQRVYRFLERNNYSIRKASHMGQPLPSKSLDLFLDFFREINRKRHKLGIFDSKDDHDRIVNIDETPIYFEMTSDKTINKKGAIKNDRTSNNENCR